MAESGLDLTRVRTLMSRVVVPLDVARGGLRFDCLVPLGHGLWTRSGADRVGLLSMSEVACTGSDRVDVDVDAVALDKRTAVNSPHDAVILSRITSPRRCLTHA